MKLSTFAFLSAIGLITIFAIPFSHSSIIYAQKNDASDSAEIDDETLDETIKILKEKIEKKVDKLNEENQKIVVGYISKIDGDTIELITDEEAEFNVSIDETISTFYSSSNSGRSEIEVSDLKKSDRILVSGPIIENQVSANVVYQQEEYIVGQGQITGTDKNNFTIDIVTSEKDEYTLDIESGTSQKIMDIDTLDIAKAGFAKYKVGDNIHFVMSKPDKGETQASAIRTLIIPQEYFAEEIN